MKKDYSEDFSQVLEVIKYIPKDDYDKIPLKTIQLLEANCNEESNFSYNIALPFEEQNLSNDAKLILAIIFRNCWITSEQKCEISKKENEYLKQSEAEKREKYNPDKLFEKKEQNIERELQENYYLEVVKEEKWYLKLWNKIKKVIKK